MEAEDIAFELEPTVEEVNIEDESDVYEMIEEGEIGYPTEYGYDDIDNFVQDVIRRVIGDQQYDILQESEKMKWTEFTEKYNHAGGVLYNPENGNEWITDREEII